MDALFRAGLTLSLIDRMTRPLARAQEQLNSFEQQAQQLSERLDRIGQGISQAGQSMMMAGGAMTAAFAAPVKFAGDFEESMADVNKVADFTDKQYRSFSSTLLDMSERIPMAAGELSQLAAAGAQMGIPKDELAEYTEMVSKLGVAFDMPAGQIGDTMGKLANVFDLPMNKVGLLGDAVNHLSNNMAAAAPDIVNALSRVGGTAANLGLAAEQTAALSSTLIAQGEAPERAGTAMNRLLVRLSQINTQSKSAQEAFSELGFNASDFSERMRKDPLPAIMDFLERAKETGKAGEYMSRVLGEEAGPKIVKLANNMDKLKGSLGSVADESLYAGSASAEFQARVSTFNSQMQLLWNTVKRVGITLGTIFLPPLTATAKAISAVISPMAKFAEKHKILSGAIFGTIGVLGIFTLVAGGVLTMLGFMAQGLAGILALQGQGIFSGMLSPLRSLWSGLGRATGAAWSWVAAQSRAAVASIAAQRSMRGLALSLGSRLLSGLKAATLAVRSFSLALLTNPVTLIAAGIATVAVMIYKYWDQLKAFFSGFFQGVQQGLAPLAPLFEGLWAAVKLVVSPVADLVSWLGSLLAPADATQKELSKFASVGRTVGRVVSWLFAPITWLARIMRMLSDVDLGQTVQFWANQISRGVGWITDAVSRFNPVALISKAMNRVTEWLSGFSLAEAGQKVMNSLWQGMEKLASKPVNAVKDVAQKVRDFLPFSPAKMGPLSDIHKTGGALMQTMAAGIQADPVARRMQSALDSARKALPAAALGASLAITPAAASVSTPQIPDLTATARWQPELSGLPQLGDVSARVGAVADIVTPRSYPEITSPERRTSAVQAGGMPQINIGGVTYSPTINAGPGEAEAIERLLAEDSWELEDTVYQAVVRALERKRRGDFGG